MDKNYDRSIELLCPTCASSQLSENSENDYTCASCNEQFSYEQVKEGNSERISVAVSEIKSEVVGDFQKQLNDIAKQFNKR